MAEAPSKIFTIALVGNPNTGKSSVFNALTGLRQHTGNFAGVTVERTVGRLNFSSGGHGNIVDLPGTYSLFPRSPDEAVPFRLLLETNSDDYPDLVVFVADAANLTRNLNLYTQIADLGLPMVLCVNMIDQAHAQGIQVNVKQLSERLGVPVVATNARRREGIKKLLEEIEAGGAVSPIRFISTEVMERAPFEELAAEMNLPSAYHALTMVHFQKADGLQNERSQQIIDDFRARNAFDTGHLQRTDLLHRHQKLRVLLEGAVCVTHNKPGYRKRQDRIDRILTHPFWGYVIFLGILFLVFQSIFNLAQYPMDWIEGAFSNLGDYLQAHMAESVFTDLLTNGILPGLSGVLMFVPQIGFLFFFIGLMEDTGYLARVAFLLDRTLRQFGLNGKSIIPLISGTACAVPAIMATRNIENRRARLITIMVTPLMSCSARLPVYILLIGLVMPRYYIGGFISMQGLALFGMYILGFVAAMGAAFVFRLILMNKQKTYFIMELPVYRMPRLSNILIQVWRKTLAFSTAAKIIVAISVILWALSSFGPGSTWNDIKMTGLGKGPERTTERLEQSFAGRLGKAIEPAIAPLGYDWKIGISLITSFAAREVFVGTMTTLYGLEDAESEAGERTLRERMLNSRRADTGEPVYSLATVISLMIFYAFAMQCMSTLAVTYHETKSMKWTMIQLFYMTGLAYVVSLIVYQLLR